ARRRRQLDRRARRLDARAPRAAGRPSRRPAPATPARVHDRRPEPAIASMSSLQRVRPPEARIPAPPQLGFRVAILGALVMAAFAIIFFRLWYLQVLSREKYVQHAEANRARHLP